MASFLIHSGEETMCLGRPGGRGSDRILIDEIDDVEGHVVGVCGGDLWRSRPKTMAWRTRFPRSRMPGMQDEMHDR